MSEERQPPSEAQVLLLAIQPLEHGVAGCCLLSYTPVELPQH